MIRTGIRRLPGGAVGGTGDPITRGSGTADGFLVTGFPTVLPAGGFAVRRRACLPTGSGVPAAGPLIILLQIGEVRLGAGVIRSQPVLSPSGSVSLRQTRSHTAVPRNSQPWSRTSRPAERVSTANAFRVPVAIECRNDRYAPTD